MRIKTDEKRQLIIDIASALFTKKGFENTSMCDISSKVGGSKATIYNYFKSKEEIFIHAVKCFANSKKEQMLCCLNERDLSVHDTLRNFGQKLLELILRPEVIAARRTIFAPTTAKSLQQMFYEQGAKQARETLTKYIDGQVKDGRLKSVDPQFAATQFLALLTNEAMELAMYNVKTDFTTDEINQIVESALTVFMAAFGIE